MAERLGEDLQRHDQGRRATETCCSVTFCSAPLRYRLSPSSCIANVRVSLLKARSALSAWGMFSNMGEPACERHACHVASHNLGGKHRLAADPSAQYL
jgi:hypothetical protein